MLLIFVNVIFVLSAITMTVLILLQRGSADAGSGFGGGASATVFGARGSANFLSKATKWLAVVFFSISLGLAIYASKSHVASTSATPDLGVMGQAPAATTPAPPTGTLPANAPAVPLPIAPPPSSSAPASSVPASTSPAAASPAVPAPQPIAPASGSSNTAKQGNKGS